MTTLRQQADGAAQDAFRRLVQRYVRTGAWDRHLFIEYQQAERELDRIDGDDFADRIAYEAAESAAWAESVATGEYAPLADPGDHVVYPMGPGR